MAGPLCIWRQKKVIMPWCDYYSITERTTMQGLSNLRLVSCTRPRIFTPTTEPFHESRFPFSSTEHRQNRRGQVVG